MCKYACKVLDIMLVGNIVFKSVILFNSLIDDIFSKLF